MKTKNPIILHKRMWTIALFAAFGMVSALHAEQATPVNTSPKKATALTATITPQEFWTRFVRLITERKGYVTHDRAEALLGFSLGVPQERTWTKEEIVIGNMYGRSSSDHWPADIGLYEYNENKPHNPNSTLFSGPPGISSNLIMDWSPKVFGDWKQGRCVLAHDATQVLLDAGWHLDRKRLGGSGSDPTDVLFDGFILGNGYLEIWHYVHIINPNDEDQSCVHRIRVTGTP